MTIAEIQKLLNASVLTGDDRLDTTVQSACGSDMMSDVLAFVKNQAVLLTGLVNAQVVRTADMMDMRCIVFVRSKMPNDEIIDLARDNDIVVLSTSMRMYEACGILYCNGLGRQAEDPS